MRAALEHPHHLRTLLSADGTLIVYAVVGDGPRDFVLAPGLGAPMSAYRFLFERFAGEFRFITWEPRGLFRSAVPEGGLAALRLENHVADLEAIAAREGARRFVLGGWSMGVQISLEYARRHPESVAALVLINGSCGHLLRGVALLGRRPRALRALVRAAAAAGPVLNLVAKLALDRRGTIRALRRLQLMARDGNLDDLQALVSEFKHLEFGRYLSMMLALDEHTCESYLHEIDIPALVTAGRRDLMTPPALGEALARRLPRGELFTFEQGTHYSLVEEPEALNRTLAPFLARALGGENRCSA
jgi:pimeloyl-ACP methyl ester carboxylesterase